MTALSVVLDTNVLVSGLAYPDSVPGRIVGAWRQGRLRVVLSRFILDETARVLPRLSRNPLSSDEIRMLLDSLVFLADIVTPANLPAVGLRDPLDEPVLATLRASDAAYLITGDKDLLAMSERYPIITPSAFWQRHGV